MPNRILKETICTSETINELTPELEVFFYRLIVQCDDFGRFDARSSIIRSRCYPLLLDKVTDKMVIDWLNTLSDSGLIKLYEADNKKYLLITTWDKHQQMRAKRSKYPAPESICNHLLADDSICPRNPIQSNKNPNSVKTVDDFVLPENIKPENWEAFLDVRKKKKAPNTTHALKLIIDELNKIGGDANEVLNQSTMRGYTGVFPLKANTTPTTRQYEDVTNAR